MELPQSETDAEDDADTLVVAFGICARIAHEAVALARSAGHRVSWFRPISLWPFNEQTFIEQASSVRKICVVECNRGQMREDIERLTAKIANRPEIEGVCTDGGVIPTTEQIIHALR